MSCQPPGFLYRGGNTASGSWFHRWSPDGAQLTAASTPVLMPSVEQSARLIWLRLVRARRRILRRVAAAVVILLLRLLLLLIDLRVVETPARRRVARRIRAAVGRVDVIRVGLRLRLNLWR